MQIRIHKTDFLYYFRRKLVGVQKSKKIDWILDTFSTPVRSFNFDQFQSKSSAVFRIRIQMNAEPAKNLNPDPEDLESGSGSKLFLNTITI